MNIILKANNRIKNDVSCVSFLLDFFFFNLFNNIKINREINRKIISKYPFDKREVQKLVE